MARATRGPARRGAAAGGCSGTLVSSAAPVAGPRAPAAGGWVAALPGARPARCGPGTRLLPPQLSPAPPPPVGLLHGAHGASGQHPPDRGDGPQTRASRWARCPGNGRRSVHGRVKLHGSSEPSAASRANRVSPSSVGASRRAGRRRRARSAGKRSPRRVQSSPPPPVLLVSSVTRTFNTCSRSCSQKAAELCPRAPRVRRTPARLSCRGGGAFSSSTTPQSEDLRFP